MLELQHHKGPLNKGPLHSIRASDSSRREAEICSENRKIFKQCNYDYTDSPPELLDSPDDYIADLRTLPDSKRQYVLKPRDRVVRISGGNYRDVKGLLLPVGPMYDPADEEDLKNEDTYQHKLKDRIDEIQFQAEDTIIPRLQLNESHERGYYYPDSLDIPDDVELDSQRLQKFSSDFVISSLGQQGSEAVKSSVHAYHPVLQYDTSYELPIDGSDLKPKFDFVAQTSPLHGRVCCKESFSNHNVISGTFLPDRHPDDGGQVCDRHGPDASTGSSYPTYKIQAQRLSNDSTLNHKHVDRHIISTEHPPRQIFGSSACRITSDSSGLPQRTDRDQESPLLNVVNGDRRRAMLVTHYAVDGCPGAFTEQQVTSCHSFHNSTLSHCEQQRRSDECFDHSIDSRIYSTAAPVFLLTANQDKLSSIVQANNERLVSDHTEVTSMADNPVDIHRFHLAVDDKSVSEVDGCSDQRSLSQLQPGCNYVLRNKGDYGRLRSRTYQAIHDEKKLENRKLLHAFAQSKNDTDVKTKQAYGSFFSRCHDVANQLRLIEGGPEELWAKKSASLSRTKNSKLKADRGTISNKEKRDSHSLLRNSRFPPGYNDANCKMLGEAVTSLPSLSHIGTTVSQVDVIPHNQQHSHGHTTTTVESVVSKPQHLTRTHPVSDFSLPGRSSGDRVISSQYSPITSSAPEVDDVVLFTNILWHDFKQDNEYFVNPYPKIPPITMDRQLRENSKSALTVAEGGYMSKYIREKDKLGKLSDKPKYKMYGIKDYKRMLSELKAGTGSLGPDLDREDFKEKREKRQRQSDYARAVQDRNMGMMVRKSVSQPRGPVDVAVASKRQQAVQYARSVPRPTVHAHSNQVQNSKSPAKTTGASHGTVALPPRQPPTVDTVGIARLHERHREDKRSVELIGRRKRSPVRKRRQTGVGVSAMRVVSQVEER